MRVELFLKRRLKRVRKLFAFLRDERMALFDDAFQAELESMYRQTGAGKAPVPPALMAMAVLLQGYVGCSDAEAVELSVVDLRWQMVLGRLGETTPAFSQGALLNFRHRLIAANMDRRLLERTAELARSTGGFDARKLPKTLRVAMDSSPLVGAGRVEDSINLLAHAGRNVARCAAVLLKRGVDDVCRSAGIPLLLASSVKKGLDRVWTTPGEKVDALNQLVAQLDSLETWLESELSGQVTKPPLGEELATLRRLREQDLEPDPDGPGVRIREGVARERRVSVEEPEMRHGRKSKSKLFNGYKRHIAKDLDTGILVACAVAPANRPEQEAAAEMNRDIAAAGARIGELSIDRGYITSPLVEQVRASGGEVLCRPWTHRNGDLFSKDQFAVDLVAMTVTCPAGQTRPIHLGRPAIFKAGVCAACPQRERCTRAKKKGRTVQIANDEQLQQELRAKAATPAGRERLRERVAVEHGLAHIGQRQGRRARYFGTRANLFDLRRAAALQNLELSHRKVA